jgi:alanine dehydrogenase
LEDMVWQPLHLREGVYLYKGALTDFYISERFHLKYTDLNLLIASKS